MGEHKVTLAVYDLTQGMARQLSPMLLGKQIDGVWHSGVIVDGVEYFFGQGIHRTRAGCTPFGTPLRTYDLGTTQIPIDVLEEVILDLGTTTFRPQDYSLLHHNCNHFSNEFAQLLTGQSVPEYLLTQAQEVLSTQMGQMLMPMIMQMESQLGGATAVGFPGAATETAALGRPSTTAASSTAHNAAITAAGTASAVPAGAVGIPSVPTAPSGAVHGAAAAARGHVTTVTQATTTTSSATADGPSLQPSAAAAAAAGATAGSDVQQGTVEPHADGAVSSETTEAASVVEPTVTTTTTVIVSTPRVPEGATEQPSVHVETITTETATTQQEPSATLKVAVLEDNAH